MQSDGMAGGTTELLLLALNDMAPGVSYRKQQDRCVVAGGDWQAWPVEIEYGEYYQGEQGRREFRILFP